MTDRPLWVITCAPEHRKREVVQLSELMRIPSNRLVTVTVPPKEIVSDSIPGYILNYPEPEMNISKWWNFGADWVDAVERKDGHQTWDIIYMESDARLMPGDVQMLRLALRAHDVGMVGSDWKNAIPPHEVDVRRGIEDMHPYRLPGFALMVRGELGLRHDPDMRWWFSDDDFEWQARTLHGTAMVGSAGLYHEGTDGLDSPDKRVFAEEDQVKFARKWHTTP